MMEFLNLIFISFVCFLAIPTLFFSFQVFFAQKVIRSSSKTEERNFRVAVLVPAHNEEDVISRTLQAIKPQLGVNDSLLVVADNCTDNTAVIAKKYSTHVIEREDENNRGKGYALDYGLQFLADSNPPEIVIVVDADCNLSSDCIDILAQKVKIEARPVQALYLMESPEKKSISQAIAEFAWLVKNQVRPLGLMRFSLPCQLMGTGMAFPWEILRQADLAHGNMVEDMKLGVDLAVSGFSPLFCPEALVSSEFPMSKDITNTQRKRWEHGHLSTILTETPRLMNAAVKQRDITLLGMALDLSIPPLSLLALCLGVMLVMNFFLAFLIGNFVAFGLMLSLSVIFSCAVLVSWYGFGRQVVSIKMLWGIPLYILQKVPLYFSFLTKRQKNWVKTERR